MTMKNILIKSKDRKIGTSSNFLYQSMCGLDGDFVLKSLLIPNTIYNVGENNNGFTLFENSVNKTVVLTKGNYTGGTLATELKLKLDAASGGFNVFTVSFLEAQGKLQITAGSTFRLIFPDKDVARTYGFKFIASDLGVSTTSDQVIDLSSPASVGIEVRETQIDNYENIATMATASFYVPIDSGFGFYKSLEVSDFPQIVKFNKIRTLNIRVVDTTTNETFELNGGEFEMLFSRV